MVSAVNRDGWLLLSTWVFWCCCLKGVWMLLYKGVSGCRLNGWLLLLFFFYYKSDIVNLANKINNIWLIISIDYVCSTWYCLIKNTHLFVFILIHYTIVCCFINFVIFSFLYKFQTFSQPDTNLSLSLSLSLSLFHFFLNISETSPSMKLMNFYFLSKVCIHFIHTQTINRTYDS